MKEYRVWAVCSERYYLDVEAESEEEARIIASHTDGSEYVPDEYHNIICSDWHIVDVEEA